LSELDLVAARFSFLRARMCGTENAVAENGDIKEAARNLI
jgi:hypothetical protein